MNRRGMSRRDFLYAAAMTATGAAIVACEPQTVVVKETVEVEKEKIVKETVEVEKVVKETVEVEKVVEKEVTKVVEKEKVVEKVVTATAAPVTYKESPILSARVDAGSAPPVEERLPIEPMVLEPYEEIGQHGGTLRVATTGTGLFSGDEQWAGAHAQQLLRLAPNLQDVVPNVAKGFEFSDDYTTFTIYMRRGMKWSDGAPLAADDAVYWWEDEFMNEEITPVKTDRLTPAGKPVVLEKLDDYTIVYRFEVPHPSFILGSLAHLVGFWAGHMRPAHFLKEYHIDYNPEAQELAVKQGLDHWYQYYGQKGDRNQNAELPNYRAFFATGDSPDAVFFERNPYFWMIDTEGNQLPYVDKMISDRLADLEMLNAKIVAGDYDFAGINTNIMNYAAYVDGSRAGNYRILLYSSGKGSEVVYNVNMNYEKDPVLRDIFSDVRFRRALSLAIDRDDLNKVVYFGQAISGQVTMIPQSRWFKEEYRQAWADFDLDQANELLDEMGLTWDAAQEVRLRPDGKALQISFDMFESETPKGPITELVKDYWKAIGVDISFKSITRSLLGPKILANEEPMGLWHGDACTDIFFPIRRKWFVPDYGDESTWAPLWGLWYNTQGEQGEEPPQEIKDLFEWYEKVQQTLGDEWAHNILKSQAENVWTIGTVGMAPHPLIVRNTLRNVVEEGIWCWDDIFNYPYYSEHWFIRKE